MPPPNVTPPPAAEQPVVQAIQQAPLALTTQSQAKSQEQTTLNSQQLPTPPPSKTPPQVQQQPIPLQQQRQQTLAANITKLNVESSSTTAPLAIPAATTVSLALSSSNTTTLTNTPLPSSATRTTNNTLEVAQSLQTKIQPPYQNASSVVSQPSQPIALATAPTTTGPTALVIIPQQTNQTSINASKTATISTKPAFLSTTTGVTTAHVTLATSTQSAPIQLQTPITTHLSNITPIPIAAHQLSSTINQSALVNRPPSTLPVVPITTTAASVSNAKGELNKYICCLLDNGIRCDRVAGNASFSARIQKIVGTKKMNFSLDPTVRHAYICEHHKAIITVAKKSTNLTRDTKANARNNTANNNPNTLAPQPNSNFNDLRQQQLQHPVNLELMANQNRLANNHAGTLNNISVRQGAHLGYTHYQGPHSNQVGSMDVMMSGNFDGTGGDGVPSSSGGVEVDLQQLQVNTLRRYKRHFRVPTRPGLNKMQLAESLKNHFRALPIIEKEAITYFVYIVKCCRNKLDHNPKAD